MIKWTRMCYQKVIPERQCRGFWGNGRAESPRNPSPLLDTGGVTLIESDKTILELGS